MRRTVWTLAGLLTAVTLVIAGCSGGSDSGDGKPTVVTSTNVWGSVAAAVAGDKATVTALYTNADGDPHEFEPSAADTASIVDADVVVLNGGGYDAYMEKASAGTDSAVVNAFSLLGHGDGTEHDHESGHDHDHGVINEHVFYDLAVVAQVADKIAAALGEKDSANADAYKANAAAFTGQITTLRDKLAAIKTAHNGTKVAQTEPLAGYLLAEAGLVDASPAGFTQSVEEGNSPAAADIAAMQDLLKNRTVRAFIYNTQAVDAVTKQMLPIAEGAGVPVLRFTETLPDGVTSYIAWQTAQIDALSAALAEPAR